MHLAGQASQRGYAMAAVLVGVAVMAIVMSALLPVWRQQSQREKEAELAFRGEQYARAIYLFQRSNGGQNPPNLDVLVSGRYIRKKYKDPVNDDGEFLPLAVGANQPGPQGGPSGQRGTPNQRGTVPGSSPGQRTGQGQV
ncbi:MAG: type II secretion system protein, partial [Acidobacteria bacterium]|nr:type II secretion system protein [Acidobacteriota bacterium]